MSTNNQSINVFDWIDLDDALPTAHRSAICSNLSTAVLFFVFHSGGKLKADYFPSRRAVVHILELKGVPYALIRYTDDFVEFRRTRRCNLLESSIAREKVCISTVHRKKVAYVPSQSLTFRTDFDHVKTSASTTYYLLLVPPVLLHMQ